jgi:hypothetical protein
MTRLDRFLLARPRLLAALQGAGSVFDLGGTGKVPPVRLPRVRPAEQSIREAWERSFRELYVETGIDIDKKDVPKEASGLKHDHSF